MAVTLYGIKNCDTVRKARKWLEKNHIAYHFHDFRTDGLDGKLINAWLNKVDWKTLLNTRGTSWRKLPESDRQNINKTKAVSLMMTRPALVKRPVLTLGKQCYVGFDEKRYKELLKK
jgi:arsenate reductase